MENSREAPASQIERARQVYQRYEQYLPIGFFVGGFLFDILTLGRIDSWLTIGQQAAYLLILAAMLMQFLVEISRQKPLSDRWRFYTQWRLPAIHFIFGSLLSAYTLFYFKSSSLATSFGFLFVLSLLLIANESHRFQSLDLGFKFALLALCTMSYFAYVVPTLLGEIGTLVFLASVVLGFLPSVLFYRWAKRWGADELTARKQVLRPALIVLVVFLFLYLFRVIPPVPLSIQYMGIYHAVEKTDDGRFQLAHQRPWWRFWHSGDQYFSAQPGDKIVVFFRLFSPARFAEEVKLIWYLHDAKYGWVLQDRIPIKIVGGRDEGFRGYAVKGNFTAGQWRVAVQTGDGREVGRLKFTVNVVPAEAREFQYDYF